MEAEAFGVLDGLVKGHPKSEANPLQMCGRARQEEVSLLFWPFSLVLATAVVLSS